MELNEVHSSVFDALAADDSDQRRSNRRVVAVAYKRATTQFLSFLMSAKDLDDFESRSDLIADDLKITVDSACVDLEQGDPERILATVKAQLIAAGGFCDSCRKWKKGPRAGCICDGGSDNAQDLLDDAPVSESQEEAAQAKEASDSTGLSDTPSPKLDKKRWVPNALNPSGNLKPLETDKNSLWPSVKQDITDKADYKDSDFLEQTKGGGTESQELPTAGFDDAGFNSDKAFDTQHTKTFGDSYKQQDPVTSRVDFLGE